MGIKIIIKQQNDLSVMICSKMTRTIFCGEFAEQQEAIVTGITDYIPQSLKSLSTINISVIGSIQQVVNQIFWNEFFAKSLIKELYYLLMHHYSTQGRQIANTVFAKLNGKVYKLGQSIEWKSELRQALLKEEKEVVQLEIQAFSNKGNIRKINIFISKHPISIQKLHITLKTDTIEPAKISKNHFPSVIENEQLRCLQETDRTNKIHHHNRQSTHKTKSSIISNPSLKPKQSLNSKQNLKRSKHSPKPPSSKFSSKKTEKKTSKEKTFESNKDYTSRYDFQSRQKTASPFPQRLSINRQSVLAKIITSKQEQIILLKEQLQEKSDEYETILMQQDEAHKKQVTHLTKSVKEILDSYSTSQKEALNENVYLKERVSVLEDNISKANEKMENYAQEIKNHLLRNRQLQEANKRLLEANKRLLQEQDRMRSTQLTECTRMTSEISMWRDKADEFRNKYQKVVEVMKNVINFT